MSSASSTQTPNTDSPLHLIWLLDFSSSMRAEGKPGSLEFAVREFADSVRRNLLGDGGSAALGVACVVSVLGFSAEASWICEEVPLADFAWSTDWIPGSIPKATNLGAALRAVGRRLDGPQAARPGPAPVLVLASDGQPTDDWIGGLQALNAVPWGRCSVRVGLRIGQDAQNTVLGSFAGPAALCETENIGQTMLSALYEAAPIRDPRTANVDRTDPSDEFPPDEAASLEW